ncbi:hypothetical protein [Streptomyces longispororuber]|uniref:hypothetical protein n=1 Tax=Streptomyces longispororuber TaxID=68230 RepID=UPI0036FA33A2
MTRLDPNPHSPHADADPQYRHLFPTPVFFPSPPPGALALAGCMALAVVPEGPLVEADPDGELPEGLCPACVTAMRGGEPPARPVSTCRACQSPTRHDGLCALCRQEAHAKWWPTRDAQSAPAGQALAPLPPEFGPAIPSKDSPYYPTQITVVCDHCGAEDTGDYMVREDMTRAERLAVARQRLVETKGWESTADGDDFCPEHAAPST